MRPVDLIVTPEEVVECGPPRRPNGILPTHLTAERMSGIPILSRRIR